MTSTQIMVEVRAPFCDIVTLTIKRKGKYFSATTVIPPELIKRYDLQDEQEVQVAFLVAKDKIKFKSVDPEKP